MNTKRDIIKGRAFAIGTALAFGINAVLIRKSLAGTTPPLVGAAIAFLSGTLILAITGMGNYERNLRQKKRSVTFLLIAGAIAGLGMVANYFALSMAAVVIVAPLANTTPLFALLWSHLFLGRLERITPRVVSGTVIVVIGIALVTIGRSS